MEARLIHSSLAATLVVALASSTAWAEEPREVPKALAKVLNRAERALKNNDAKSALNIIKSYSGPEDALHALVAGHAYQTLNQLTMAEKSYRAALKLDPKLNAANIGLAQVLVDQSKWAEAATILGKIIKIDSSTASELGLYARVAYELRDARLASLIVERAILRFPQDLSFRRLDIALLTDQGKNQEAYDAALALLARAPNDRKVWKQLAAISDSSDDTQMKLAALEAALLANESDVKLQKRLALAQYHAGHFDEALSRVSTLIKASQPEVALIQLGVRIAEESDRDEQANRWLSLIPKQKRTKTLTLLEARLAIKSGKQQAARRALDRLIRAGEATPNVLLWAGQLAEQAGALAKAEAMYQQASTMKGSAGRIAVLHLARLFHKVGQLNRASQLLSTYIAKHPDDQPARELLVVINRGNQTVYQN